MALFREARPTVRERSYSGVALGGQQLVALLDILLVGEARGLQHGALHHFAVVADQGAARFRAAFELDDVDIDAGLT